MTEWSEKVPIAKSSQKRINDENATVVLPVVEVFCGAFTGAAVLS